MVRFIDPLESRVLLSASSTQIISDELKIVSDAKAARSDVFHYAPVLKSDAKSILNDVKALANTTQNRTLSSHLSTDATNWVSRLKADVLTIIRAGGADARRAVADGIAVFLNANNTAARARLAVDLTHLQIATNGPISKLLSDAGSARTAILNDLNSISSANSSNTTLKTDVLHASTDTQNVSNVATADVQKLQGDVTTLVKDLG
jgi:hypothetical protein